MINEITPLNQIERQLSKLESTATNLETISVLATRANRSQEAKTLSDQAVDLRVKQFSLCRNKDRLQVDTKEKNGRRLYQPLNSSITLLMKRWQI